MIEINNLSYAYQKNQWVLETINLTIKKGSMITILGQNGSGKTTLVKHLNGLLKPVQGDVIIDGINTKETTIATMSKKGAYVFQNPNHQIFSNSVYNEIAFSLKKQKMPHLEIESKVHRVMEDLGISEIKDIHPMFINQAQKQMVAVASYLVMNPEIFIFDEPTSSLDAFDVATMNRVFDVLKEQGKTIIVITHDMNFVIHYPDRVIVMHKAKQIFDGHASKLFASPKIFIKTGLEVPQIKTLCHRLQPLIPEDVYHLDQVLEILIQKGGLS